MSLWPEEEIREAMTIFPLPYDKRRFRTMLRRKHKMTINPTKHEQLFHKALIEAQKAVMREDGLYTGHIKQQRIFIKNKTAYIADFMLPLLRLVFEVDGIEHQYKKEYDNRRTRFINSRRYHVARFQNVEVEQADIVAKICQAIRDRAKAIPEKKTVCRKSDQIKPNMSKEVQEYLSKGGKITICPAGGKNVRFGRCMLMGDPMHPEG